MKTIISFRKMLLLCLVLSSGILFSQVQAIETFDASKDVIVEINTSHTNVVIETWNKDKVEVIARVDGADLSEAEKRKILDSWDYEVLGNSKKVVVTSNSHNVWQGMAGVHNMDALKNLPKMPLLKDFSFEMPEFNFDFKVPEVPELAKFPVWPFSGDQPNFKDGNAYNHYDIKHGNKHTFDKGEYKQNKQAYVDKLNKKFNSNVSVREVDSWLEEVDEWSENVEDVMEEWGEKFGKEFGENFGADFELKMEKWGEEFGKHFGENYEKDMEKWGADFGKRMEEFGKQFEEKYGKDMEKWGEEYGKQMEEWAKQFEDQGGNYSKQVMTDPYGNKSIIIQGSGKGDYKQVKANKTIIIKMPKGAKTDVNVRYGELKMADAFNIKATLNYSPFTANSIDGGKTLINASYAPVVVNNWNNGTLFLKYIDDCRLNTVNRIDLESTSSNVIINVVNDVAVLSGSFGDIRVKKVSDNFKTVQLNLDNTDAFIAIPNTAFNFNFNGKKSTLLYPKSLQLSQDKQNGRVLVSGFNKNRNSGNNFTINAHYSNLKLQ